MTFPRDFLWGAGTSAYQIEGATREDGRGPSVWDEFAAQPGRTHLGQTGEIAADHYHRAEQDISLIAQLGLTALAIPRIRARSTAARIGPALNLFPIFAGDKRPETIQAVQRADRFHNRWFLDPLYLGQYPADLFSDLGVAPPPIHDGDFQII